MNIYIWAIIVLFSLSIIGNAILLAKQKFTRDASSMIIDIAMLIGFIIWGIWLLAATPSIP